MIQGGRTCFFYDFYIYDYVCGKFLMESRLIQQRLDEKFCDGCWVELEGRKLQEKKFLPCSAVELSRVYTTCDVTDSDRELDSKQKTSAILPTRSLQQQGGNVVILKIMDGWLWKYELNTWYVLEIWKCFWESFTGVDYHFWPHNPFNDFKSNFLANYTLKLKLTSPSNL